MLLADSNFWVALAIAKHEFHAAVNLWLRERSGPERVCFCRSTQQSFLRLMTTEAVMRRYGLPVLSNRVAWSIYEERMSDDRFGWLDEPAGLNAQWKKWSATPRSVAQAMDGRISRRIYYGKADTNLLQSDSGFKQYVGLSLVLLANE